MTNAEFIRRLRRARKFVANEAGTLVAACERAGIWLNRNAEFGAATTWDDCPNGWMLTRKNYISAARAVFDNSIRALGGKP